MINANNGSVIVKGHAAILCNEAEGILRAIRNGLENSMGKDDAKDMITEIYKNSLLDDEERNKKIDANLEEMKEELKELKKKLKEIVDNE